MNAQMHSEEEIEPGMRALVCTAVAEENPLSH
jgi:hypothetical protein